MRSRSILVSMVLAALSNPAPVAAPAAGGAPPQPRKPVLPQPVIDKRAA
jgi:hypothetical protein